MTNRREKFRAADINDLVSLGEGFTIEFKRSVTSDMGREICAFANASGGTILTGVGNDGKIHGVSDHNRIKSEIQSIARSADPPVAVEIESVDEIILVTARQALFFRRQVLHARRGKHSADVP